MYESLLLSHSQLSQFLAAKERLIGVMKVVLDIANQSTDFFPPLKSALGCINTLINHYDVRFYRITSQK